MPVSAHADATVTLRSELSALLRFRVIFPFLATLVREKKTNLKRHLSHISHRVQVDSSVTAQLYLWNFSLRNYT